MGRMSRHSLPSTEDPIEGGHTINHSEWVLDNDVIAMLWDRPLILTPDHNDRIAARCPAPSLHHMYIMVDLSNNLLVN